MAAGERLVLVVAGAAVVVVVVAAAVAIVAWALAGKKDDPRQQQLTWGPPRRSAEEAQQGVGVGRVGHLAAHRPEALLQGPHPRHPHAQALRPGLQRGEGGGLDRPDGDQAHAARGVVRHDGGHRLLGVRGIRRTTRCNCTLVRG